jgi:hypothetical protein
MTSPRIPQLLNSLDQILLEKHPLWAEGAKPGLTEQEVREYLQSEALPEKEELVQFYMWHNGVDLMQPELDITKFGSFIGMEDALRVYRYFIEEEANPWAKQMFPLSWDDSLLFGLNDGVIYLYAPSLLVIEPESVYDSMETLLITQITLLEQGVIRYSKKGEDKVDFKKMSEISKQINPNSIYWKKDTIAN